MDEVLKPDDEMLSTLAAQMGLRSPEPAPSDKTKTRKPAAKTPPQKSYAQLT